MSLHDHRIQLATEVSFHAPKPTLETEFNIRSNSWAIAYATPYLVNAGPGNANLQAKVFYIWGSFCTICAFFVWTMIYETKGLSLEQVDELYAKVPHAWNSRSFVPTVSFQEVQQVGVESRKQSLADLEGQARRKSSAHPAAAEKEAEEKV